MHKTVPRAWAKNMKKLFFSLAALLGVTFFASANAEPATTETLVPENETTAVVNLESATVDEYGNVDFEINLPTLTTEQEDLLAQWACGDNCGNGQCNCC